MTCKVLVISFVLKTTPLSSTNKTDSHDVTESLLKEALNAIKQTNKHSKSQNKGRRKPPITSRLSVIE